MLKINPNRKPKLNPNLVIDYAANVLPKKAAELPLSELDKAVEKALICAQKGDEKGLRAAEELIGRLAVNKK